MLKIGVLESQRILLYDEGSASIIGQIVIYHHEQLPNCKQTAMDEPSFGVYRGRGSAKGRVPSKAHDTSTKPESNY